MMGPCAKTQVECLLVCEDGNCFIGSNWCENAQETCPRLPGEDYTKCKTICNQSGHAELDALRLAEDKAKGAKAYIKGHTYACKDCQEALYGAGVKSISVVKSFEEIFG